MSKFINKMSKAESLMDEATNIYIRQGGKLEEAEMALEEQTRLIRDMANYIETDDTTKIFSCFGPNGEPVWSKEYIVFRLRDTIGECYTDENGKERE